MIDAGFLDSEDIKNIEKATCKDVQSTVMKAKESSPLLSRNYGRICTQRIIV
jgi:hypothetical protein